MNIKKHIPNTITCCNLFVGILAVLAAYNGAFLYALGFVLLAALFDFLDGMMARLLNAYSPLGKELDSLADMISFGFLPGMIAFKLLQTTHLPIWMAYFGFLLTIFSALRLAKFNIDERQTSSFLGLATPANALFWVGVAIQFDGTQDWNTYLLLPLVFLFSYLLVCEVPMFSLKFKSLKWNDNKIRYIFLIGSVVALAVFQLSAISIIILWYLLLSFIEKISKTKRCS